MVLQDAYCRNSRSPVIAGAVFVAVLTVFGSGQALANDVLFRGTNSLFSAAAVALSDDVLANARAMGADTSLSLDLGPQQRLSVILWDDLKRQGGQGSGSVSGNTVISVTTAQ